MIKYLIAILALLCVGVDLAILHQIRHRHPVKHWARNLYLIYFVAFDVAIVAALLFYERAVGSYSAEFMQFILWVIALFLMNLLPKSIYLLVSTFDYPVGKLIGKQVRWFTWSGLGCATVLLGAMIWGATSGRNHIVINEITISSERLPKAFDGYRIAQFSDLHIGNLSKHNQLITQMVRKINTLQVDMVVNSGDLVNLSSKELNEHIMAQLGQIKAQDGVYAVLGNHDLGFYMRPDSSFTPRQSLDQLKEKQARMGWVMLNNTSTTLHRGTDSITVSGVNFPVSEHHNGLDSGLAGCDLRATYATINPQVFNLLIAHTPNLWEEALEVGAPDLTLSGHVHAMQLKLALGTLLFSPAQWMYKRWSGLYEKAGKYLYINDGMGYVMYPMRLGAYPEITLFTLRSLKPSSVNPPHPAQ